MFALARALPAALVVASAVAAPDFPAPYNTAGHPAVPALAPAKAEAAIRLPKGFKATVFAAEPDVQNPVAMAWDGRGRLWIAENYTYAERSLKFDLRLRDRVLILEDRDGDGRFDVRQVFGDEYQRLTSVEVGRGGVWLMCPPQLLFVPDGNEDGVPDGPAQVVLDGFTVPAANYHNFANGLRFGPDGWLYGRCGASSPGEIGAPGTPPEARVPLRGTVWRYHPDRKVVEVLSAGTTNPWGHDWDPHGELFFINTVNGHLWHGIAGAHYVRAHTLDANPHAYELIDMHADHWHFDTSQDWTKSRDGAANALGGGHAHAGVMIYQGDDWPGPYRGKLYTLNFHGRRINTESLAREGSGYVARHAPDAVLFDDPWFRGIDLASGPDGGVFVLDWNDTGECHQATGVNRTSGRIYKITYGDPARRGPDNLQDSGGRSLAGLQTHPNAWYARRAQLELAQRAALGHPLTHAVEDLNALFAQNADSVVQCRALWTLHAIGAAQPAFLRAQLRHANEHVRTWAIRLLTDGWPLDTTLGRRPARPEPVRDPSLLADLVRLAREDASALVRLTLASTLQRLPVAERADLATALARRTEDRTDHNQPLMLWYGLMPLGESDPGALARIAGECELPATRRLAARRLAEESERVPAALNALLVRVTGRDDAFRSDVIDGLVEGFNGWRRVTKPEAWDALVAAASAGPASLKEKLRDLAVLFGDGRSLDDVRALALNSKAELTSRQKALRALIEARPPDLQAVCAAVLRVRFLNAIAVRGLALFDDPRVGDQLAAAFGSFHPSEREVLISTLVSRRAFARSLLAHVATGRIPREEITPYHARQIRALNDPELTKALASAWGELREPAADKQALIARLKAELQPAALASADKARGRVAFQSVCAACHTLYGQGGTLGPDLTGAGRDNLDYLVDNIADPSAVVTADYRMCTVKLKDGRALSGFISARTTRTLTLRSISESTTVERADIAAIEESPQSVMPDGLLEALTAEQRRDLFAYLMHPTQVPLP